MERNEVLVHRYIEEDGTLRELKVRFIESSCKDGVTSLVENIETGERYDCFTQDLKKPKEDEAPPELSKLLQF